MKLPDEDRSDREDSDVLQRVRAHTDAVERALPPLTGAEIRRATNTAAVSSDIRRGRVPFLAAAAALLVAGGIAVFVLGRGGADTQLEAATSTDTGVVSGTLESGAPESDSASVDVESEPEPQAAEVETESDEEGGVEGESDDGSSETADFPDLTPIPVAAADFGAPEVRYLPSSDSGFVVADGSQVLLSEADLEPEVATPVRTQRVSLPATDPEDRRGIVLTVSTYATETDADAVVEAEPTPHGVGDPVDVGDRSGYWHEEEGFAPFSAGNPMRIIGVLRVRFDANTVLDVASADVPRAELESLVASVVLSEDGSLQAPTPPAGFDGVEPIDGVSARQAIVDPSASDYLFLGLVGVNDEQVSLTVSAESDGLSATDADFETASGYGWIETGLFGETVVSVVRPEITLVLVNYDGRVTAEELIALGGAVQPVGDETWVERLAIAPLFTAPVAAGPIEG